MSEAEKRRRIKYKENRKKWIVIQAVFIFALLLAILFSSLTYYRLNKTYYVEYNEKGSVDYRAKYFATEEYGDWVESGNSYIAALTEAFHINFVYELGMQAENVDYNYTYGVDALLEVTDKTNKLPIYSPVFNLIEEKEVKQNSSNNLRVAQTVAVDYQHFNNLAKDFLQKHSLSDLATASLTVQMNINVSGNSEEFENSKENSYSFSVKMPLNEATFAVSTYESITQGANKVLACKEDGMQDIFRHAAIAFSIACAVAILILVSFIYLTRNDDINYTIKVKRIVSAYKSYIQKIINPFDEQGYQLLMVNTFTEMLGIRDTIQSPILMNENEDMTMTRFYIPTNTKILYVFEIKVDNYDELYANAEAPTPVDEGGNDAAPIEEEIEVCTEAVVEEIAEEAPVEETPVEEAPVEEAPVEEAPAEEAPVEEAPAEEAPAEEAPVEEPAAPAHEFVLEDDQHAMFPSASPVAADDEAIRIVNGQIVHVRYRTSFTSRLIQSEAPIQDYYTAVKNHLLSYKGVKARTSWNFESFNKGRIQCAKLNVKGTAFQVYLALDPKEYNDNKYYFTDVSDKPKLGDVPMMLKVKSERALKYAIELIDEVMKKNGIVKAKEAPAVDYHMPYETTEALVDKGHVKVIFPDGMVIDENTVVEKLNVSELMKIVKPTSDGQLTIDEVIEQVMAEPDIELETIDYVDEIDEVYEETEDKPGVEVIGVVWPERAHKNKIYRYDPNGHQIADGDEVIVPTMDVHKGREIIRKAAVAHGNHKVDPDSLKHPLKKIIGVVKRKLESALSE
ncbi:MAG: hypothetical protein J6Q68_01450 [Clostridia bacterium]|nr:hypothetical protein [Clostridia bacterium]